MCSRQTEREKEMIIKISKSNGNWHYIGQVNEVSTKIMAEHELPKYPDTEKYDCFYQDYEDVSKLAGSEPMPKQMFTMLTAYLANGKTMGICVDKQIYLLNDEGKTIERL